jgi:chloramphenicol O-acetyltransferase type A
MASYPRKAHFEYFLDLGYPYTGVTVMIDITRFLNCVREEKRPFFLSFLYYVGQAANEVPQLRQRIAGKGIVEYNNCQTSHTVMKADQTFAYCQLACNQEFSKFLPYAKQRQEEVKRNGTIEKESQQSDSYLFVSCLPWLHYSALTQATPIPADSNPRISWGRYEPYGPKCLMPVSLQVHHGLVDGIHISTFYEKLQNYIMR